ncbi:hypothetical protein LIER_10055 [Lithospermum erythrorhizon]|uniref:Uncharacterized protein n=1 Tax=Lithospermum erythrorhizon TaxID=34254 RepID=A0AAV3PLV8_LITER
MADHSQPIKDPYAVLAQSMKHIVQAANMVHVLARRLDHLARINSHLGYQKSTENLSKTAEERAKRAEDFTQERDKEKETAKAWTLRWANLG